MSFFTHPWVVLGRATPFTPARIVLGRFRVLEDACAAAPDLKRRWRCYAVAVRAA